MVLNGALNLKGSEMIEDIRESERLPFRQHLGNRKILLATVLPDQLFEKYNQIIDSVNNNEPPV